MIFHKAFTIIAKVFAINDYVCKMGKKSSAPSLSYEMKSNVLFSKMKSKQWFRLHRKPFKSCILKCFKIKIS